MHLDLGAFGKLHLFQSLENAILPLGANLIAFALAIQDYLRGRTATAKFSTPAALPVAHPPPPS